MTALYPYTDADLDTAFNALSESLFDTTRDSPCTGCEPNPKMLIVAGAQGSGKTYLLQKRLLPSGRYDNYVRLYLPSFRTLHPHYAQMKAKGVLHVYEHTERFVWALGDRVFNHAFANRYNIIMETALDSPNFADFPPVAVKAGYQFEVHLIACQKEFSHWATLDRGVKSIEKGELERFLPLSQIETSQLNARAILDAFEDACIQVPGSQITLYHRGMQTDMESLPLCHSRCDAPLQLTPEADHQGRPFARLPDINASFSIVRNPQANFPCAYLQYAQVVHAGMIDPNVRRKMVMASCKTLNRAQTLLPKVPADVFRELSLYVLKYIYP